MVTSGRSEALTVRLHYNNSRGGRERGGAYRQRRTARRRRGRWAWWQSPIEQLPSDAGGNPLSAVLHLRFRGCGFRLAGLRHRSAAELFDGASQLEQVRGQSWVGTLPWAGFRNDNFPILSCFRILAGGTVGAPQDVFQYGDGDQQNQQSHDTRSP